MFVCTTGHVSTGAKPRAGLVTVETNRLALSQLVEEFLVGIHVAETPATTTETIGAHADLGGWVHVVTVDLIEPQLGADGGHSQRIPGS